MTNWDERYRRGDYPTDPEPSPLLQHYLPHMPSGRALDVATGTGRNALALAEAGYAVEALDQSRVGLERARERARERGVADRIDWLQADVDTVALPTDRYAVVTVSFFRALDRVPALADALADGGYLFVEHHLRSTDSTPSGPGSDRYRLASNELLQAAIDLTVLYYDETTEPRPDDRRRASARLLARNSAGASQSYPPRWR